MTCRHNQRLTILSKGMLFLFLEFRGGNSIAFTPGAEVWHICMWGHEHLCRQWVSVSVSSQGVWNQWIEVGCSPVDLQALIDCSPCSKLLHFGRGMPLSPTSDRSAAVKMFPLAWQHFAGAAKIVELFVKSILILWRRKIKSRMGGSNVIHGRIWFPGCALPIGCEMGTTETCAGSRVDISCPSLSKAYSSLAHKWTLTTGNHGESWKQPLPP